MPRVEDFRLVTGQGRFSDDVSIDGALAGVFLRSPYAHARILSVDIGAARRSRGVVAILSAADMEDAGVGNVSVPTPIPGRGGRKLIVPHRPALASGKVMHVGQPVLLVVAETQSAAQDAADLVDIAYEELPSVTDTAAALDPSAPQLWPEAPGNVAIDWPGPLPDVANEAEVAGILSAAAYRVAFNGINQRVSGAPLEPRSATASFDATNGRTTLHCGSQGTGALRAQMAAILAVEPDTIRVLTEDVGGGFGVKTPGYPEYAALMIAAQKLGRPVHWAASRAEAFMSDNQGRDNIAAAELALDAEGRFLALKVDAVVAMGAFLSANGAHIATANFARCFPSVYDIARIAIGVRCVFTNTVPTGPYRGAGRPEANYTIERLIDMAARQIGRDPVELRRINLIRPDAMPYRTAVGTTFDSGDFATILDRALVSADHAGFPARRAAACSRGKLRGIGVACFLEHAGGQGTESADLAFPAQADPSGAKLRFTVGVQSNGQGHATVYRRMLADRLGIPEGLVAVRQGDSDFGLKGGPSVASRSTLTVSTAMAKAVETLIAKGRKLAADQFEAAEHDVVYNAGHFEIAGTDRRLSLFTLAELTRPGECETSALDSRETTEAPQTFPNGCHIAEVEIDPETGDVRVESYVAVDDCGNVLNHAMVEGQVLGGLAQGLGQALMERIVYDRESGQLVTGTFNDYAMPRAQDMPNTRIEDHEVPCTTNPLGVKGVGEAGTTGSIGAIMNAIADAIPDGRGFGLQMPATSEKIWNACRGAF